MGRPLSLSVLTCKMRGLSQTTCQGTFLKPVVLCTLLVPQEPGASPARGGEQMYLLLSR